MFNAEEWSMLLVFHSEFKDLTIHDFRVMQMQAGNKELEDLCGHIIEKLEKMTEQEYDALDFTEYEEYEYDYEDWDF